MALRPWSGPNPPLGIGWQPNMASPQAVGLRAWFPTVDAAAPGMVRDRMGGPLPTASGNVSITPRPIVGKALTFDGTDDYLVWTNALADFSGKVSTFSFWARLIAGDAFGSIVFGDANMYWDFPTGTQVYVHGALSVVSFTGTVFDSTWHHWALVSSGTDCYVYRDGFLIGQQNTAGYNRAAGATTFNIGRYVGGASWDTNGDMADLRLYNRVLSAAEVFALYDPRTRWALYGVPWARKASALSVIFRRTLSQYGARIGSRQAVG